MEEKINKIYKLTIACIILVSLNLIITFISNINVKKSTPTTNAETTQTTESSTYDVSMFKTVSLSELLKLFDDTKNSYVVYLGRETCSACQKFLPTLQKMQSKYNYTTQYLDITTVDTSSSNYETLIKKLNKKITINVNGEEKTDELGAFYGYTPMTFIIEKGKIKNGAVGAYSEEKFENWLNDNGIK